MRDAWKPPLRMRHGGRIWHLQGAFLGSELCGHQTALSRGCSGWSHYDSDLARLGVGPYSFQLTGADWWEHLADAFVFSNATDQTKFCYFAPNNKHVLELTNGLLHASGSPHRVRVDPQTRGLARSLNVDWIYASG